MEERGGARRTNLYRTTEVGNYAAIEAGGEITAGWRISK